MRGAAVAALFHEPRPDLELAVEERSWRVRCGWVLPPAAGPGARFQKRCGGYLGSPPLAEQRAYCTARTQPAW